MEQTVNYWLCYSVCPHVHHLPTHFTGFIKAFFTCLKKKKKKKEPKTLIAKFLLAPLTSSSVQYSSLLSQCYFLLNYVLLDPEALLTMFRLQICSVPSWSFSSPSKCFKRIVTVLFTLGSSLDAFRKSFIFVNVGLMPVCMASYFAVL